MATVDKVIYANFSFAKWDADENYIVAFCNTMKAIPCDKVHLTFEGKESFWKKSSAFTKDEAIALLTRMEKHWQCVKDK